MTRLRTTTLLVAAIVGALLAGGTAPAEALAPGINFIDVFAGDGRYGTTGDGGSATSASIVAPNDVAIATDGDVYIASAGRVRRVDATTGVITTVAGTGGSGFGGDGGPAKDATFSGIWSIALDRFENLYIAEPNGRIRRVDAGTGTIDTYVGGGWRAPDGATRTTAAFDGIKELAIDSRGTLYFSSGGSTYGFYRMNPFDGIVRSIPFERWPTAGIDLAIDSKDRVYTTTPTMPGVLQVFDPTTATVSNLTTTLTEHGRGSRLTIDRARDIAYLAHTTYSLPSRSGQIDALDLNTGATARVAGNDARGTSGDGGPALMAAVAPWGMAVSPAGLLYLASSESHTVRRIACGAIGGSGDPVASCLWR